MELREESSDSDFRKIDIKSRDLYSLRTSFSVEQDSEDLLIVPISFLLYLYVRGGVGAQGTAEISDLELPLANYC